MFIILSKISMPVQMMMEVAVKIQAVKIQAVKIQAVKIQAVKIQAQTF
jgi:hypothetical protein